MKKITVILMIALLLINSMLCAVAETEDPIQNQLAENVETTPFPDSEEDISDEPSKKVVLDEPALVNPQDRYEMFLEETDESDQLIWEMIDYFNDEETLVAENGSVRVTIEQVSDTGEREPAAYTILQDSPYGHMMIVTPMIQFPGLLGVYQWENRQYVVELGKITSQEDSFSEDFDTTWHWFCFPFMALETTHGMRGEDDNYICYLIRNYDDTMSEYVTTGAFHLEEIRVYYKDSDDVYRLGNIVSYETGPAYDIPQSILDDLEKNPMPITTEEESEAD